MKCHRERNNSTVTRRVPPRRRSRQPGPASRTVVPVLRRRLARRPAGKTGRCWRRFSVGRHPVQAASRSNASKVPTSHLLHERLGWPAGWAGVDALFRLLRARAVQER